MAGWLPPRMFLDRRLSTDAGPGRSAGGRWRQFVTALTGPKLRGPGLIGPVAGGATLTGPMRRILFPDPAIPDARKWVLAAAFLGASLLARVTLHPWLIPFPFLPFFPSLVATALICGWRQGMVVLAVSSGISLLYFRDIPGVASLVQSGPVVGIIAYAVVGGAIVACVAAVAGLLRALEQARHAQENLFRELQHRVANNMQVVAAMLLTARRGVADPAALDVIDQAGARIRAMAQLHRRLYDPLAYAGGLQPVLADTLADTLAGLTVTTTLHIDAVALSVDQMTAVLLLVNEAALNAAKHVFRPALGHSFEVWLPKLERGRMRLCVRDDGPGVAGSAAPEAGRRQMGMSVMHALARQLESEMQVSAGPGTTLLVEFGGD